MLTLETVLEWLHELVELHLLHGIEDVLPRERFLLVGLREAVGRAGRVQHEHRRRAGDGAAGLLSGSAKLIVMAN